MLKAINQNINALEHASDELKNNSKFMESVAIIENLKKTKVQSLVGTPPS